MKTKLKYNCPLCGRKMKPIYGGHDDLVGWTCSKRKCKLNDTNMIDYLTSRDLNKIKRNLGGGTKMITNDTGAGE